MRNKEVEEILYLWSLLEVDLQLTVWSVELTCPAGRSVSAGQGLTGSARFYTFPDQPNYPKNTLLENPNISVRTLYQNTDLAFQNYNHRVQNYNQNVKYI